MKLNTKKKERARHHKNEAQGDTNTGRKKKKTFPRSLTAASLVKTSQLIPYCDQPPLNLQFERSHL